MGPGTLKGVKNLGEAGLRVRIHPNVPYILGHGGEEVHVHLSYTVPCFRCNQINRGNFGAGSATTFCQEKDIILNLYQCPTPPQLPSYLPLPRPERLQPSPTPAPRPEHVKQDILKVNEEHFENTNRYVGMVRTLPTKAIMKEGPM